MDLFGQVVRAHRRRLALTQEELADKTGLSARSIRNLELDRVQTPRAATVRRLADAFGLESAQRAAFQRLAGLGPARQPAAILPDLGVPAQLPADVAAFTGRSAELAWLDALLLGAVSATERPEAVLISSASGVPGVGKTALAIHWAHRVRDRFPDGQLYLDLRGYGPDRPMAVTEVLTRLLDALGVRPHGTALDLNLLTERYRATIAGRRMLIVLDNASAAEQVQPALPVGSSCATLVTSRDELTGLAAAARVHRLEVSALPPGDAIGLLRSLVGVRVTAAPSSAATLAELCARLPVALRVAAGVAVARPSTPLRELVAQLAGRQRTRGTDPGADPRAAAYAVLCWSVRQLTREAAGMFGSLGWHPGPDFDAGAAAVLVDTEPAPARQVLDQLVRAQLIHRLPGGRYGMHDLLREYAVELAGTEERAGERSPVRRRLVDYYLATAAHATRTLYPIEWHRRSRRPSASTPAAELASPSAARRWLEAERACLVRLAAQRWTDDTAVELSRTLHSYLLGGHHVDALILHGLAYDAADRAGDRAGQAIALLGLGLVRARLGQHEYAAHHLDRARVLFHQVGDRAGEARALGGRADVEVALGRYLAAAAGFERALALARQAGDLLGEARMLASLGRLSEKLGRERGHRDSVVLAQQ